MLLLGSRITPAHGEARAVLFNGTSASPETRIAVFALVGIVNRGPARLYLLNVYEAWSYRYTDARWADIYQARGNVAFDTITSLQTLVDRFRNRIGVCWRRTRDSAGTILNLGLRRML